MPSIDEGENYDRRMAALLAVHLVGQVLDEAYVIVNSAEDSGQPWSSLSVLKNLRSGNTGDAGSFLVSKGDSDSVNENNAEHAANIVATSTPHKDTDEANKKARAENSFIGQGDEEFDMLQNELSKSTSMFLNQLFDMSDVERVVTCEDTEIVAQSIPAPNNLLTKTMTKIMESYVNTAFDIAFGQDPQVLKLFGETTREFEDEQGEKSQCTENSCFTFRADTFHVDDNVASDINLQIEEEVVELGVEDKQTDLEEIKEEITEKSDTTHYENTYLTLNRDYEQFSDDDGDPVLQDPKGLIMQEVELLTASTSEDNLIADPEPEVKEEKKELAAISGVSAMSGSRKSKGSLASRCRSHGARLLSCLRGWWRRKTPGKRKENRGPASIRGLCPLSPDARRRASSLLDQRHLYSPPPSRSVGWKFNTVSEALVSSSRWKEYTFEVKPDECG